MEAFFKRILHSIIMSILTGKSDATPEEAQAALKRFIAEAVKDGTEAIKDVVDNIADQVPRQIDTLEKNALSNLDSMDGKIGNLNQQLTDIPGDVVEGVVRGVLDPIRELLKNPLGGFFGQR